MDELAQRDVRLAEAYVAALGRRVGDHSARRRPDDRTRRDEISLGIQAKHAAHGELFECVAGKQLRAERLTVWGSRAIVRPVNSKWCIDGCDRKSDLTA